MRATDVIALAKGIKASWNTKDPYKIAERFGIEVLFRDVTMKGFTAQTVKIPGYPTIISINNAYDENSKRILCAHELGHALLHEEIINHFASTNKSITTDTEIDANLFALALLMDEEVENQLNVPLKSMSNYLLKSIIDYNLKFEN